MAQDGFAARLTELRESAGMSQYALAKATGLSKQMISRLELGKNQPSWETVQRIAAALGTDCRAFADSDLVAEIEPPKKAIRKGKQ